MEQSSRTSPDTVTANLDNPPSGNRNSSPRISSFARPDERGVVDSEQLLQIHVESSFEKTSFLLPVSLMLQRELEMQSTAKVRSIARDQWPGSRLYLSWNELQSNQSAEDVVGEKDKIIIHLSPETGMEDYSELVWRPWLTTCIRTYYNTGSIRIPEECLGSDILLALEYFGILTSSTDTFVFERNHPVDRIQSWSSYFSHRDTLSKLILAEIEPSSDSQSRLWVVAEEYNETRATQTVQVDGVTASLFPLSTNETGRDHQRFLSFKVVHRCFADSNVGHRLSREMPTRMRRDFCRRVDKLLNGHQVSTSFDTERVKVTSSTGRIATRLQPVFRLHTRSMGRMTVPEIGIASQTEVPVISPAKRLTTSDQQNKELRLSSLRKHDRIEKPLSKQIQHAETNENSRHHRPPATRNEAQISKDKRDCCVLGSSDERPGIGKQPRHPRRQFEMTETNSTTPQNAPNAEPCESSIISAPFDEPHSGGVVRTMNQEITRSTGQHPTSRSTEIVTGNVAQMPFDPLFPVGFVNTAFGDLQSVTSALSDPTLDDPTVGSLSSRFLAQNLQRSLHPDSTIEKGPLVQDLQRPLHPEATKSMKSLAQNLQRPLQQVAAKGKKPAAHVVLQDSPAPVKTETAVVTTPTQVALAKEMDSFPQQDESMGHSEKKNSDAARRRRQNKPNTKPEYGYWEGLLASVCESVVPSSARHDCPPSPIRKVVLQSTGHVGLNERLGTSLHEKNWHPSGCHEALDEINILPSNESELANTAEAIRQSLKGQFLGFGLDTAATDELESNSSRRKTAHHKRKVGSGRKKAQASFTANKKEKETESSGGITRGRQVKSRAQGFAERGHSAVQECKLGKPDLCELPPREPRSRRRKQPAIARKKSSKF